MNFLMYPIFSKTFPIYLKPKISLIRFHSLSFVVPLVAICCHSLSSIATRCHSLSLDLLLVCLFINNYFNSKLAMKVFNKFFKAFRKPSIYLTFTCD